MKKDNSSLSAKAGNPINQEIQFKEQLRAFKLIASMDQGQLPTSKQVIRQYL